MSFEVEEEEVSDGWLPEREGFDPGEVDFVSAEGFECFGEGAGFVGDLEENCGAVGPGLFGDSVTDDGEASDVILVIFDAFGDDGDVVLNGGLSAGDGCDVGFIAGQLGGGGGAGDFDQPGMWHVAGEPVAALGERLRLAVDFGDFAAITAGEEVVVDVHEYFAADSQRQSGEHVESVDDASVGAVFDGDDTEVDVSAVDLFEDRRDGADGDEVGGFTESRDCGLVGEAELWSEVSDADLPDSLAAGAEEGTKNGAEFGGCEWPVIDTVDGVPDLLLVEVREGDAGGWAGAFHFFEIQGDAAVEKVYELFVDAGDLDFGWQCGIGGRGG